MGKQGLMHWLLRRIKAKTPFDANKLYASELLSILLQHTQENRLLLGDIDGIDVLLQQLAVCVFVFFTNYYFMQCYRAIQIQRKFDIIAVLQEARSTDCRGTRDDGKLI